MAKHNKTLHILASKLGLLAEDKVLSKADEFQRLLQTKWTAGSNISDTTKVVICLDLAAMTLGAELDSKSVIKYSGLKPTTYANSRKIVENLLELNNDKLSISTLCLSLQCNEVQELADQILKEYQRTAKMEVDFNLAQYVCMAVFHACRLNKVKISKSKLIAKSRLKPTQWTKLDSDWTKFVDANFTVAKKKRGKSNYTVETLKNEETMDIDCHKTDGIQQDIIESYENWKRRMLDTAYKELKTLEKTEKCKSVTPRKSPRKSIQKFSPYHSPSKTPLKTPSKTPLRTPIKDEEITDIDCHETHGSQKDIIEPYENWKKRMLDMAYKELKTLEKMEKCKSVTSRKSPRKSIQKFSPYQILARLI